MENVTIVDIVVKVIEVLGLKSNEHAKNKKRTGWNFFNTSRRDWKEVQHLQEQAQTIGLRLDYNSDSRMINLFTPSVKDHKADMLEVQSNVSGLTSQDSNDEWWLDLIK